MSKRASSNAVTTHALLDDIDFPESSSDSDFRIEDHDDIGSDCTDDDDDDKDDDDKDDDDDDDDDDDEDDEDNEGNNGGPNENGDDMENDGDNDDDEEDDDRVYEKKSKHKNININSKDSDNNNGINYNIHNDLNNHNRTNASINNNILNKTNLNNRKQSMTKSQNINELSNKNLSNLTIAQLLDYLAKNKPSIEYLTSDKSNIKLLTSKVCCACLGDRSDDTNEIVECDNCGITVHEGCYGISDSNSVSSTISSCSTEPWFCESCKANAIDPTCELCPNKGGIFKETDVGKWVHLVCALYVPGVAFGEVDQLSSVTLFEMPYSKWGAKICSLCEDVNFSRSGVCIGCDAGMCKTYFHVTCAQAAGLLSEAHSEEVDHADPFYAHCKIHSDKTLIKHRKRNYNTLRLKMELQKNNYHEQIKSVKLSLDQQKRIDRKLKKHRNRYITHKLSKNEPWVPTQKMPRLLNTSATACRRLILKAELMGFNTAALEFQEVQMAALFDIRKKWHIAPALTVEFIGYYLDRITRLKEIKTNLQEQLILNKKLVGEQQNLREVYDDIMKLNIEKTSRYISLTDRINQLHETIIALCPSKNLPSVENIGRATVTPPLPITIVQAPTVRPMSVPTAAALKMGVGFPLTNLPGTNEDTNRILSTQCQSNSELLHECGICKRCNDQHLLAKCDTCHLHYHLGCLNPPLTRHPKKSKLYGWQCSECDKSDDSDTTTKIQVVGPRKSRTKYSKDGTIVPFDYPTSPPPPPPPPPSSTPQLPSTPNAQSTTPVTTLNKSLQNIDTSPISNNKKATNLNASTSSATSNNTKKGYTRNSLSTSSSSSSLCSLPSSTTTTTTTRKKAAIDNLENSLIENDLDLVKSSSNSSSSINNDKTKQNTSTKRGGGKKMKISNSNDHSFDDPLDITEIEKNCIDALDTETISDCNDNNNKKDMAIETIKIINGTKSPTKSPQQLRINQVNSPHTRMSSTPIPSSRTTSVLSNSSKLLASDEKLNSKSTVMIGINENLALMNQMQLSKTISINNLEVIDPEKSIVKNETLPLLDNTDNNKNTQINNINDANVKETIPCDNETVLNNHNISTNAVDTVDAAATVDCDVSAPISAPENTDSSQQTGPELINFKRKRRKEKHRSRHGSDSDRTSKKHKKQRKKDRHDNENSTENIQRIKIKFKALPPLPGEATAEPQFYYVSADMQSTSSAKSLQSSSVSKSAPSPSPPPPPPPPLSSASFTSTSSLLSSSSLDLQSTTVTTKSNCPKPLLPPLIRSRRLSVFTPYKYLQYQQELPQHLSRRASMTTTTNSVIGLNNSSTSSSSTAAATSSSPNQILSCFVCNVAGTPQELAQCDECRNNYHFQCLEPPLKKTPKRRGYSWHCAECDPTDVESN